MRVRRHVLVLVAVVTAGVLSGCGLLGPGATEGSAAEGAGPGSDEDSWVLVSQGAVPPSGAAARGRSYAPSPLPGLLPLPSGAPSPQASPYCGPTQRSAPLTGLSVEPGAGSAVVSWYRAGEPELIEYRLTPMPQVIVGGEQPDLEWTTVAPGAGCRTISVTVSGLERNAPYIFSLDAVTKNYNADGYRTATVSRSLVVWTT